MSEHRMPKTLELSAMFLSGDKLSDSEGKSIWIVATHSDMEINNRIYTAFAMRNGTISFTKPYKKPVLMNHDDYRDAIGRVQEAYYFYKEDWGAAERLMGKDGIKFPENATGAIVLKADIRDEEAAAKIEDERYFSVSIGFTTEVARCSICDKNWADGPCKHIPGRKYGDEKCVLILEHMDFREISFVNEPADKYARVVIPESDVETTFYNADKPAETDGVDESNTPTITEEDIMGDEKLKDLELKVEKLEKLEKIAKSEIVKSMEEKLKAIDLNDGKRDYNAMDIDTLSTFRDMVVEIIDAAVTKFTNKAEEIAVGESATVQVESKETDSNKAEPVNDEPNKTQESKDNLSDVNIVAKLTEKDAAKPEQEVVKTDENASKDSAESEGENVAKPESETVVNTEADKAKTETITEDAAKTDSEEKNKKRISIEDKNAVISTDVSENRVTERPLERAKKLLGIK